MCNVHRLPDAEVGHFSLAGQTFAHKTGRSEDICISGKDQSDHSMGYRVHSKLRQRLHVKF